MGLLLKVAQIMELPDFAVVPDGKLSARQQAYLLDKLKGRKPEEFPEDTKDPLGIGKGKIPGDEPGKTTTKLMRIA